jgi:hypothetical protein
LFRLTTSSAATQLTDHQNAELVGLIFDGNIQSLVGDFIYDESVNRAISMLSRGMLEVLRKFSMRMIVDERQRAFILSNTERWIVIRLRVIDARRRGTVDRQGRSSGRY